MIRKYIEKQNNIPKSPNLIINKPILWIGHFVCFFILIISSVSYALLYKEEHKWLFIIPASSLIIFLISVWYMKMLKKQINDIHNYSIWCKDNEKILHQLLYYDNLTGLPNRKMLLDEMNRMIEEDKNIKFYLIYFDIDDFKRINETAGYFVGDEILRQVSCRWNSITRDKDLLGRLSGDEFSLLIKGDLDRDRLLEYLEKFRGILSEPISLFGKDYLISASFGIAEYPCDGKDGVEILKSADIAMSMAKKSGKNFIQFYTYEMQLEILKRLQIENGLLYSVKNNELYMVYQPMYHCETKALRGFEALARWKYPGIGFVGPSQFIPIAEETGIIVDIGKWIIHEVLTKFMELQRRYQFSTIVSINISVVQMIDSSFVSMIKDVIKETGFDSKYLELEITESVLISYPEQIIDIIKQLRALGIRVALDDFGTGYASLSYLQMLPINVLKIDKSFIDKINIEDSMNQIVEHIINLAHRLGIEVVAEGVEKEEQLNFLLQHGCDYIQGHLLSAPLEDELIINQFLSLQNN
ncbi:hypothetical protein SD1D_0976 [Herbinix luporum]|jgi:diguanylate cyclase (GGDEF)-like protein|uniref:Bifunctional diguanylate cyclase/phosphodiesterase n=2 Tax=Herbinix luporum TaxID=1679721 RepID=A0A0K8J5A1_9FIRM|nr:hypothetical protein SD1D_0976 [Herbinix luporum]